MKNNQNKVILTSFCALFSAMTTVAILLFHIPIGVGAGYVHLGDCIIYLAGSILPMPYAVIAASVGAGLADLLSGYPIYIIPSLIIKALVVVLFTSKAREKILVKKNYFALVLAVVVTVGGYALSEFIIFSLIYGQNESAFGAMLATIIPNLVQAVSSAALYVAVAACLDKAKIKSKLNFNQKEKSYV